MDRAEFLDHVRTDWEKWQSVVDAVGEARMAQPGAAGEWSVKDIVAHITWFEREMVDLIRERALAGSEHWDLPTDERNAAIYAEVHALPLDQVLHDTATVHAQLVEALEELPEEHYGNPARFRDMPADWLPWRIFAGNTFEHYRHHAADVRRWLDAQVTV